MVEGRSALKKWVLRDGIQVAISLNQWAESCVRRAPFSGTPYGNISIRVYIINDLTVYKVSGCRWSFMMLSSLSKTLIDTKNKFANGCMSYAVVKGKTADRHK